MLQDSLFWNYGIFIFTIITILPSSVGKGGFLHCQRYSPNRERFPDPLVLVEHRYFLCLVQSDKGQKRNLIMLCFSACCASLLVLRKLILLGSGERGCYQQQISGVKWWCAPTKYYWRYDLKDYRFWISRGKLHRTFLRFYVNWIVYSGVGACAWERRLGDDGGGGVAQNVAKVRDTDRGLGPA